MTMMESFAVSDVGRVRTNNEDCVLILPEIGLYLLADGMGGARAGEMASRLAIDTVAEVAAAKPPRAGRERRDRDQHAPRQDRAGKDCDQQADADQQRDADELIADRRQWWKRPSRFLSF